MSDAGSESGTVTATISLGLTRQRCRFLVSKGGTVTEMELPFGLGMVAPQFYKGTTSMFPNKIRESQLVLAGSEFFPIPYSKPALNDAEQDAYRQIRKTAFVRGFHMAPQEIHDMVVRRYWPQKKIKEERGMAADERTGKGNLNLLKPQIFRGRTALADQDIGEMWCDEHRLQGPDDATGFWQRSMSQDMGSRSRSRSGIPGFGSSAQESFFYKP